MTPATVSARCAFYPRAFVSTALLLCVERGPLEAQSRLCVESLRTFGGELAEMPVYAFAPRPGEEPSEATAAALGEMGVTMVAEPLNPDHPDLPHTNKVFAAAWAEVNVDADAIVFADSDTVFLAEPAELAACDWDAAARPVGAVNMGSTGADHKNEADWELLYDELGVSARPFVETVVSEERIRAYFNAGLVAFSRASGLATAWRDATLTLLGSPVARRAPLRRQIDQLALGGVLAEPFDRVRILPDTYNYPLPKRVKLPQRLQALELDDLVHIHGHKWLHLPGFLSEVRPELDTSSERYRWLDARLPLEPEIEGPFRWAIDS